MPPSSALSGHKYQEVYQSIYNNLHPEAMGRFKMGEMVISTAAEMSGLDSDNQRAALRKDRITLEDIRLLKQ